MQNSKSENIYQKATQAVYKELQSPNNDGRVEAKAETLRRVTAGAMVETFRRSTAWAKAENLWRPMAGVKGETLRRPTQAGTVW